MNGIWNCGKESSRNSSGKAYLLPYPIQDSFWAFTPATLVHDGKNAKSSCTQPTRLWVVSFLCCFFARQDVQNLHPFPFYINRQAWMATTWPLWENGLIEQKVRSLWGELFIHAFVYLLTFFLAHVDCALSSCPELNQKYCYTWWLHSQPDSWTRLMIEQDGANVRPESSCLLICEDSHSRYQWHCDLTTAQIMRELAQPSRMGRYYNADMFFPLLSLPSLIS